MTELEEAYNEFVSNLIKDPEQILNTLDPDQVDALHMAVGIAGEAGELLDAIKKYVIYNKPIDLPNVIEELGDLEFYMAGLREVFALDRESIIRGNMYKLQQRYRGEYSDAAAHERKDKADGE